MSILLVILIYVLTGMVIITFAADHGQLESIKTKHGNIAMVLTIIVFTIVWPLVFFMKDE
jgi:hypothetical protein